MILKIWNDTNKGLCVLLLCLGLCFSLMPASAVMAEEILEDTGTAEAVSEAEDGAADPLGDALKAHPEGSKLYNSVAREKVQPSIIELADGEYAIPVEVSGGSGKATVNSPAIIRVTDGVATVTLIWSSTHYDYMIAAGEVYEPLEKEGYSTFSIPITTYDEPMIVIADTTAMSTPHEVEYRMFFDSEGVMSKDETPQAAAKRVVYMVCAIIAVCMIVSFVKSRRKV